MKVVRGIILLLVLAVAGGAVWVYLQSRGPIQEEMGLEGEWGDEGGTRTITLFFADMQGEGLISESRQIRARRHRDEEVEAVLREWLKGPKSSSAMLPLPPQTRLRNAFYDESQRLLYLDFNQAMVSGQLGGSLSEMMALRAILRTIAIDFPEVELVQILVDGLEVETLGGHVDLSRPLRTGDWL